MKTSVVDVDDGIWRAERETFMQPLKYTVHLAARKRRNEKKISLGFNFAFQVEHPNAWTINCYS